MLLMCKGHWIQFKVCKNQRPRASDISDGLGILEVLESNLLSPEISLFICMYITIANRGGVRPEISHEIIV